MTIKITKESDKVFQDAQATGTGYAVLKVYTGPKPSTPDEEPKGELIYYGRFNPCVGCGECNPNRRCLGCMHQF